MKGIQGALPNTMKADAELAIRTVLPPQTAMALIMDCLWPETERCYKANHPSSEAPTYSQFMTTMIEASGGEIPDSFYRWLAEWALVGLYARVNNDFALTAMGMKALERAWAEFRTTAGLSSVMSIPPDRDPELKARKICVALKITNTASIHFQFVTLSVIGTMKCGVRYREIVAPEIAKHGVEWMCGKREDAAHFLASFFRFAARRSKADFLQQFSETELKLPRYEPESMRYSGWRYFHDTGGSGNPMYVRAAEAALSPDWETEQDPLAWISSEARNEVDRRIRKDAGSRGDALHHRLRRIENLDSRSIEEAERGLSVIARASAMDSEFREELVQSLARYMRKDAKTYFGLTMEGLTLRQIVGRTGWTQTRAETAKKSMERSRQRASRILRERPLRGLRVSLANGICREYLDSDREPNSGRPWTYKHPSIDSATDIKI